MRAALLAPLAAVALLGSGCGGKERSPEGAVELFLRAAIDGDATEVYRLLSPSSQRELQERARLAGAQAAGRSVKPEDLLAVSRDPQHREDDLQIRTTAVEGDRARVEIYDKSRPSVRETLSLERVDGRWRVQLPPPFAPTAAPSAPPASAPGSRPAPATRPANGPAVP